MFGRDRAVVGWTLAIFAFAAIDGMALQARGALLPSFAETFGVTERWLGLITPAGTVGFVLVVVAIGLVAGRLSARRWVLLGIVGTALGFVLLGLAPTFIVLLAMFALRSAATGIVRGLDRPIVSHLYPTQRGRVFNLHTMAWAVGATTGPLLVTAVIFVADWRVVYGLLAIALVPVFILVWRLPAPPGAADERSLTRADFAAIVRTPELLVMGAALVMIGGLESVFFTWLPYYVGQFFDPAVANLALSVYLAAYVPGRLLFARLARHHSYIGLVTGAAILTVLALIGTFAVAGTASMFVGIFVLGLLISGLFPTMLAWGVDSAPSFTGPINAAALASAQLGFFTFPFAVGVLAEWQSIEQAIVLQVVLGSVLVVVAIAGRWYTR